MAQLEEAWTVNRAVDGSIPNCVKLTKSLQRAFNLKIAESFGSRPKPGCHVYHNNIVGILKVRLYPAHIGQVGSLSGAVSPGVLRFISLRNTLSVPEVVGTENWVNSSLPSLLNPSSIAQNQS